MRRSRSAHCHRYAGRRWARRGRVLGTAGKWIGWAALWTLVLPAVALVGLGISALLLNLVTRLF